MLELVKPVTLETDVNKDIKSNKENNTKVANNKSNSNTEEMIANDDTSDTFLKPSRSAVNPKDVKKAVDLTQVCAEKKRINRKKNRRKCW